MKTVPATAAEIKSASGVSHRIALRVSFANTEYCYTSDGWDPGFASTVRLRQHVAQWGGCNAVLEAADPAAFAQAMFSVTILDPDSELYALWEDEQFQRREIALYWAIFTPGEAEPSYTDAVLIMRGVIVPPTQWTEGMREMSFEITDLSIQYETLVGVRATIEDFPYIGESYEGKIVPLVYGHPDMVEPVWTNGGIEAKLYTLIQSSGTGNIVQVDDARRFPQGVSRLYVVGRELMQITFNGNVGNVAVREVDIWSSTTTAASTGSCTLIDTALGALTDVKYPDNCFVGFEILTQVDESPGAAFIFWTSYSMKQTVSLPTFSFQQAGFDTDQARHVIRMVKSQDKMEWNRPFVVEQSILDDGAGSWDINGVQLQVGTGANYDVGTEIEGHIPGDRVFLWHPTATTYNLGTPPDWPYQDYLIGMGECTVRQVYVHGHVYKPRTIYYAHIQGPFAMGTLTNMADSWLHSKEAARTEPKDTWVPLRNDLWSVDTITVDGQTVSRLRIICRPTWLIDYICTTDDIRVDISGPSDAGGSVIQNPAEVIEDIFARYGGYASERGLEAYWTLDETGGNVVGDSADAHDGTRTRQVRFRPDAGRIDGCAEFDTNVNYALQSSNLDVAPWIAVGCGVVADQASGTIGQTLDRVTKTVAASLMRQDFAAGTISDGRVTLSAYYREGNGGQPRIYAFQQAPVGVTHDVTFAWVGGNLTVSVETAGVGNVTNLGGGLWRADVRSTTVWDDALASRVYLHVNGGVGDYLYIGDVQLENSPVPTAYQRNYTQVIWPQITIPNDSTLQAACAGQFSVAFWVRSEDPGNVFGIMEKRPTAAGVTGFMIWYSAATPGIFIRGGGANNAIGRYTFDSSWHHVAAVFNNTAAAIYVDGVALTMTDAVIDTTIVSTDPLLLGVIDSAGTPIHFNGFLDDVRIYNRLLSSSEISALSTPQRGNLDCSAPQENLTSWLMSFARPEITPLRNLVADLARQSRCRLRWLDENPDLLYLGVDGGEINYDFGTPDMLYGSAVTSREELEQSASRVTAHWIEDGESKAYTEIDSTADDDLGERDRDVDAWAYDRAAEPTVLARFYLHLWRELHNRGTCALTLDGVGLEPGDIIELDTTLDGLLAFAPTKGRLVSVTHEAGGSPDMLPREEIEFKAFRWDGCNSACEGSCETTACEDACESYWEPTGCAFKCETDCEDTCELGCETGGELFCSDHECETGLVMGCYWLCQQDAMVDCGSCEDNCQCLCETGGCECAGAEGA